MDRWTKEDLNPHAGVWAVIPGEDKNTVLIQKHKKLGKWTIPIGKASLLENPEEAIKRELKEECGIEVGDLTLLFKGNTTHTREGFPANKVTMPTFMYLINKYSGKVKNMEPHKHSEQKFMSVDELSRKGEPLSDALQYYIKQFHRIAG